MEFWQCLDNVLAFKRVTFQHFTSTIRAGLLPPLPPMPSVSMPWPGGGVTWYILGWGGGTRPLIRWPSLRQKSLIFPFCLKLNTLFLYQSTLCSEILNGIKILRYLCNNTNTEPRSGEVNIHHFHRHWVNNGFSIYHTSWITSGPKSNFLCDNIPTKAILFLRLKYVLYIKHWTHFSRSSKGLS